MNCSGRFLKVWAIKEQNGFIKLDLGDSKKMKDGSYQNWTWYGCTPVGKAKDIVVGEGDKIEITSGQISQGKGNDDKWYTNITIFDFTVTESANPVKQAEEMVAIDDLDSDMDLPF